MTVRLGELVESGEICNTRWYSVHGWIQLRGSENPILLQLTGNCDPDLAGWRIRFQSREHPGVVVSDQARETVEKPTAVDPASLAGEQIGPTGTMTATRRVKVAQCTRAEFEHRSRLGEPPPRTWSLCLHLEWFSQDGHVVVELPDPIIEFVEYSQLEDPRESESLDTGTTGPSFAPDPDESMSCASGSDDESSSSCSPMPHLFGSEAFDDVESLDEEEAEWFSDEDKPQFIREMELMDELIERGDGEIIGSLFDGPVRFPRPDQLDDAAAEEALKSLLARMAVYNISLDVCEHFSPREAYRLLVERICVEEQAYPELRHTQWIQHFTTSEFCRQCEAEWERECEELERRRKPPALDEPWRDDEGSGDDTTPF
jgi:hypothetical protein